MHFIFLHSDFILKTNVLKLIIGNLVSFQWDLFRLNEIEVFDAMLMRLHKQELEQIVMSYEAYRSALIREMERRKKENQVPSQSRALPQSVEHQKQIQNEGLLPGRLYNISAQGSGQPPPRGLPQAFSKMLVMDFLEMWIKYLLYLSLLACLSLCKVQWSNKIWCVQI